MNCKPADDTGLPTETALPLKKFPHVMFGPRLELLLGYAPGKALTVMRYIAEEKSRSRFRNFTQWPQR